MLLKVRSIASFSRNLALVLLALAVFGWALQARIGPAKPPTAQTHDPAKLSTETDTVKVLDSVFHMDAKKLPSPVATLAFVSLLLLTLPVLEAAAHRAKILLDSPGRFFLFGSVSRNRPPPVLL